MGTVWERATDLAVGTAVATTFGAQVMAVQQANTGATAETVAQTLQFSEDAREIAESITEARARGDEVAEQTEGPDEPDSAEHADPPDGALVPDLAALAAADRDDAAQAAGIDTAMLDATADDAAVAEAEAGAVGEAGGL